jgi:2-polyprenyl-3-methyl-5-hydroxy-6-metoxy-1,4-benzoquinol methylase
MKCLICGGKAQKSIKNLFDDRYGAPGKYNVFKCTKCGFGRLDPVLKEKEIGNFYAKYYPLSTFTKDEVLKSSHPFLNFKDWFYGVDNIAHKYVKGGAEVLDIGSASGLSLIEIKQLGAAAYGVEPDPEAQKLAKKLKLNVHMGTLKINTYSKKKFDYITASQVIEHELDPESFLKIAKSKLSENGKIILAFPNTDSIYRRFFDKRWINWHVPYHCNFFSIHSINLLAANCGLKVIKLRTITPTVWTIQQIRSLKNPAVENQKNIIWEKTQTKGAHSNRSIWMKITEQIILISISSANRIIDSLNLGDSILVFLEPNE